MSLCESGRDGSCPGGDPSWSPVGCKPPLRSGTYHPALQWAAPSLWCHHYCHTHQTGIAHPNKRPAAASWRGTNIKRHTLIRKSSDSKLQASLFVEYVLHTKAAQSALQKQCVIRSQTIVWTEKVLKYVKSRGAKMVGKIQPNKGTEKQFNFKSA